MSKFTHHLWSDLAQRARPDPRARRPARAGPGPSPPASAVLAGSTLALAGVGTALAARRGRRRAARRPSPSRRTATLGAGDDQPKLGASPGERQAQRDGHPRADHDLHGARGGSRQRPGDLFAGAGYVGADGEGSPGHGRHVGHPGPLGQHRRWHLAPGPLRRHE